MTDEKQLVKDTFIQYSDAFAKLDPNALAPFYHLPAILIDSERIFSVNSEEEILKILTPMIKGLISVRYDRSKTTNLSAKLLSKNTALVSGIGIRLTKDDKELGKFGSLIPFVKLMKNLMKSGKLLLEKFMILKLLYNLNKDIFFSFKMYLSSFS